MATHSYSETTPYFPVPSSISPPPPPPPPRLPTPPSLANLISIIILGIVLYPSRLLIRLLGLMSSTDSVSDFISTNFRGPSNAESEYRILFAEESSNKLRRRAGFVAFASVPATLFIPALRSSYFLGSRLFYWSLFSTVVFCSRFFIEVFLYISACILEIFYGQVNKRWSYYALLLYPPLGSTVHSTFILLTWIILGFSSKLHPVTAYGRWAAVAWLFRSVLIVLNTAVSSRWKANAIYQRYEERILRMGFEFHILYKLIPRAIDLSFMAPWRKKEWEVETAEVASDVEVYYQVEDHIRYVSVHRITTWQVAVITVCGQYLTAFLPADLGGEVGELVRAHQQISPEDGKLIDKQWLKERLGLTDEDARVLYGELSALVSSPAEVSFDIFALWLNGAYKFNQALGKFLRQEEDAIINSHRLLMMLLINGSFFLWLFFTGKTLTKVFSVIPFAYSVKCFVEELLTPQFQMLIGS